MYLKDIKNIPNIALIGYSVLVYNTDTEKNYLPSSVNHPVVSVNDTPQCWGT